MLQPNFNPFPELSTERLILRRITTGDTNEIFKLRSDERVMKYIDKERAASIKDAEIFFNLINDSANANSGITWAITLKQSPDKMIGNIGFWRLIKEHYRAEIGYMLHPDFWNKGIMKEALAAAIDFGFNQMKLHSIEAQINTGNTASAHILESVGFIKEAHFKENYFFQGIFSDTIVYSKLNSGAAQIVSI
jgi:ribosomal-protein-alanine N-acetyltransferase